MRNKEMTMTLTPRNFTDLEIQEMIDYVNKNKVPAMPARTPHDLEIQEMIDYDNKVPANKVSKFEAVIEVIMVRDNVYRVCGRVTDIE